MTLEVTVCGRKLQEMKEQNISNIQGKPGFRATANLTEELVCPKVLFGDAGIL